MFKTKDLTEAALLCSIAAILQLIPLFISDVFTILTLLSTFPIFLITKKHRSLGGIAYLTTAFIIFLFHIQEGLIFIFMNGLLGVSLGYLNHYIKPKAMVITIAGLILSLSILLVNFIIGIPLFGATIEFTLMTVLLILIFSIVYCTFIDYFMSLLIKRSTLFQRYLTKED
jgi:uncharacterized protein YybS (DUF2232 family)